jgi:hypothetical protein
VEHYDQAESVFRAGLDKSDGLSDEQKATFARASAKAVRSLPTGAAQRVAKNLRNVKFFPDHKKVTEEWLKFISEDPTPEEIEDANRTRENLKQGKVIGGYYIMSGRRGGTMVLSGSIRGATASTPGAKYRAVGTRGEHRVDQVYLHEMWHAVDSGYELSESPEWQAAFEGEIKDKEISRYAWTHSAEGFAEFGRFVTHADQETLEGLKKDMPRCYRFFEKNKLLP